MDIDLNLVAGMGAAAGVIALVAAVWRGATNLSLLNERIQAWTKLFEEKFQGHEKRLDSHGETLREHSAAISEIQRRGGIS